MVGITEISAALSSLQAVKTILGGMDAVRTATAGNEIKIALQGAVLDVQQSLLSAQQVQTALTDQKAQLEQEIVRLKDWSGEQARYELVAVASGAFAYMQKEGMRTGEVAHWLCANCFGSRKKSILQAHRKDREATKPWICPACKSSIVTFYTVNPEYGVAT